MLKKFDYIEQINFELPYGLYKIKNIESRAIGSYLNKIQNMTDLLELEVSPITCSFDNLINWEIFLNLPTNFNDKTEDRRLKVLLELFQYMGDENVIRKDEMESIISLYSKCSINEHPSLYEFHVNILLFNEINLGNITNTIRKIKPSYLDYEINIDFKQKDSELKVAMTLISGEEITAYPYSPRLIESRGEVIQTIGNNSGLESVTIYPKARKE